MLSSSMIVNVRAPATEVVPNDRFLLGFYGVTRSVPPDGDRLARIADVEPTKGSSEAWRFGGSSASGFARPSLGPRVA